MTIGAMLTFAYLTVELRMPKEINADENIVIQGVNYLPFLNHLTYFELGFVLKTVIYPSLFNTSLNISRLIDVEPLIEFKKKMLEAQKSLTTTLLPLEMSIQKRQHDEDYIAFVKEEKEKKAAEKAKKEEEEKAKQPAVEAASDKKEDADQDEQQKKVEPEEDDAPVPAKPEEEGGENAQTPDCDESKTPE